MMIIVAQLETKTFLCSDDDDDNEDETIYYNMKECSQSAQQREWLCGCYFLCLLCDGTCSLEFILFYNRAKKGLFWIMYIFRNS